MLCGDATSLAAVAKPLGERKPALMVTDPPYAIQLHSQWRDKAGLNSCGPAETSHMKHRSGGHTETTISERASVSEPLLPSSADCNREPPAISDRHKAKPKAEKCANGHRRSGRNMQHRSDHHDGSACQSGNGVKVRA